MVEEHPNTKFIIRICWNSIYQKKFWLDNDTYLYHIFWYKMLIWTVYRWRHNQDMKLIGSICFLVFSERIQSWNGNDISLKGRFVTSDCTGESNSRETDLHNVQIGTEQFLHQKNMVGTVPFIILLPNFIALVYFTFNSYCLSYNARSHAYKNYEC